VFQLFANKKSIQDGLYNEYLEYIVFFDESIRGLTTGAPVEYRGIRIGTVAAAPYFFNVKNPLQLALDKGIPVLIRIESGRLYDKLTLKQLQQEIDNAVAQGLKAVLKTGNLLTGGLYVDLNINDEDKPAAQVAAATAQPVPVSADVSGVITPPLAALEDTTFMGYRVLPTGRSGLGHIEQKVLKVLDKINALPVEQVLTQANTTMTDAQAMMQQAQQLLASLDKIAAAKSTQQLPEELQKTMQELRQALAGFSPGSPVYERLNGNLQSLDKVLRDLQPVIQTLNQQSNALVFGAEAVADPQPQQGTQP